MKKVTLVMDDILYEFYSKIGKNVGKSPEVTMNDALLRLAGELSMRALEEKRKRSDCTAVTPFYRGI